MVNRSCRKHLPHGRKWLISVLPVALPFVNLWRRYVENFKDTVYPSAFFCPCKKNWLAYSHTITWLIHTNISTPLQQSGQCGHYFSCLVFWLLCVYVFKASVLLYAATATNRILIDLIWLLQAIFNSSIRKLPSSPTLSLSLHLPHSLPPICPDLHGCHMAPAPWLGILWKICRR